MSISITKQRALLKVRGLFLYASNHPVYVAWGNLAQESFGFYDGTDQYDKKIQDALKAMGQRPFVVNKIHNLVNYMSGVEVQTRFRVAFRSHQNNEEEAALAKALTHLGYYIQESQDIPAKASLKFRDALICGLGWSHIYKDPVNGGYYYEYVHPYNMIFDPDDVTHDLSAMNYVFRLRWMTIDDALDLWPMHKRALEDLIDQRLNIESPGSHSSEIDLHQNKARIVSPDDPDVSGNRIRIVECQHRERATIYKGFDASGNSFATFDPEVAKHMDDVEESTGSQIMRTVFFNDLLLEHAPLVPAIPEMKDFCYLPMVWSRRTTDTVPFGWIEQMKPIQQNYNLTELKLSQALFSHRVHLDAMDMTTNDLGYFEELFARPSYVHVKQRDSTTQVLDNLNISNGYFTRLKEIDQQFQLVSGVFNELLGAQTNAVSGEAIKNRQVASVRNNVIFFDKFKTQKKREGRLLLRLIQGGEDDNILVHILDEEEQQTMILNQTGEGLELDNDIRRIDLDIFVEEIPDFESSIEERRATLLQILNHPQAPLLLQSAEFLKWLGIRDYKAMAQEYQGITQQQAQAEKSSKMSPTGDPSGDVLGGLGI